MFRGLLGDLYDDERKPLVKYQEAHRIIVNSIEQKLTQLAEDDQQIQPAVAQLIGRFKNTKSIDGVVALLRSTTNPFSTATSIYKSDIASVLVDFIFEIEAFEKKTTRLSNRYLHKLKKSVKKLVDYVRNDSELASNETMRNRINGLEAAANSLQSKMTTQDYTQTIANIYINLYDIKKNHKQISNIFTNKRHTTISHILANIFLALTVVGACFQIRNKCKYGHFGLFFGRTTREKYADDISDSLQHIQRTKRRY